MNADLSELLAWPWWAIALIALAALVSVALLIAALIVLFRTPVERLTAPRVVWLLICFINFVGPIAFLAAGRKPATIDVAAPPPPIDGGNQRAKVIDELYGKDE